jgi:hypothetical protein
MDEDYQGLLTRNLKLLRELNDISKVNFIQNILWPEMTKEMYNYALSIDDFESCDMLKFFL